MTVFLFLLMWLTIVIGGAILFTYLKIRYKIDNTELPLVILSSISYLGYWQMPPFFSNDGDLQIGPAFLKLVLLVLTIELLDVKADPLQLKKITLPSMVPAAVGPSYGGVDQEQETTIDKINKWLLRRSKWQRIALYSFPIILVVQFFLNGILDALISYGNYLLMSAIVVWSRKMRGKIV